jgi:nitroreductase
MKVFSKEAETDYDIHELMRRRWSPRAFADKLVEPEKLQRIFEAARWAPSSMNEQPWRFILGIKGDETYDKIMQTLVEFNQIWAPTAPVLILSLGHKVFTDSEKINDTYRYDVGQAIAHLSLQAMAEGLYVHQMGGFDPAAAVRIFKINAQYKPLTVTAVGYLGEPEILPERMAEGEYKKRVRRPLSETVFMNGMEETADLFRK